MLTLQLFPQGHAELELGACIRGSKDISTTHVYHTLLVKFSTDEGFFVLPNVFGIHEFLTTRHLRSTERVL